MKEIIGLTGLYCSGKTTIEKILKEKYGYFIIDVDKIGHIILEQKKIEIIKYFGKSIIKNDNIDRKQLGKIVFNNKKKLLLLNSILHPEMKKKICEIINSCINDKICINAAILFEMELDKLCSKILVVKASLLNIIKRGIKRDKKSIFDIIKILSNQKVLTFAKKNKYNVEIHFINNNNNNLEKQISSIIEREL